jgi:hypothetical protein
LLLAVYFGVEITDEGRSLYIGSFCPAMPETEEISAPTRPVENVALTTKGLQERKHNIKWDDGAKIGKSNC